MQNKRYSFSSIDNLSFKSCRFHNTKLYHFINDMYISHNSTKYKPTSNISLHMSDTPFRFLQATISDTVH